MILSVPSYVIPGTYLENLRFLEGQKTVRNVELLFFSYDDDARTLLEAELAGIKGLRSRFSFTVHLPDPLTEAATALVEACADFAAQFILHPPKKGQSLSKFTALAETWRSRFGDRFLLENTQYATFEAASTALPGFPLCMDTGHLLLEGNDPATFAYENSSKIRQIHLHGIASGRDHAVFSPGDDWFLRLAPFLRSFDGIVELELFDWGKIDAMLPILQSKMLINV